MPVIQVVVSEAMADAVDTAVGWMKRAGRSELVREDCIRPLLQELNLWPSRTGVEDEEAK